jgi:hypothetical protein
MPTAYNKKVIVSGNHVEVYRFENPIWRGFESHQNKDKGSKRVLTTEEQRQYEEKKIKSSLNRAKTEVKRLVNSNPQLNKFLTLTFAKNLTDIETTNKLFNQFTKRTSYKYKSFQYLVVPEFQKRGAVHYHMLCSLPFIEMKRLTKLWGHGYVWIERIEDSKNIRSYLTKYLTKDLFAENMSGKKKFFRSKTLRQPKEHLGEMAELFGQTYLSKQCPVFESEYVSEWAGKIKYQAYKLDFEPPQNQHLTV